MDGKSERGRAQRPQRRTLHGKPNSGENRVAEVPLLFVRPCPVWCTLLFYPPVKNSVQSPHAEAHPIPPGPRHLLLSPRSPQNRPRHRPETPRRLRQHPYRACRIDLHLEGQTRNFARTTPAHQKHRSPPQIPGKGSPPHPLLQNPRIPRPPNLCRLPCLPLLAGDQCGLNNASYALGRFCCLFARVWQARRHTKRRWPKSKAAHRQPQNDRVGSWPGVAYREPSTLSAKQYLLLAVGRSYTYNNA